MNNDNNIDVWKELEKVSEEELYPHIHFTLQEELETEEEHNKFLTEMANMPGKYMKIEDIDFSFYVSEKNSNHAIRLKIGWNREYLISSECGYMELHGDYEYHQSKHLKYKPKSYEIATVRYFAKKYKVLFAAVWEMKLPASDLVEYFRKGITWEELMHQFINLSEDIRDVLAHCRNLKDLEFAVRKNNAFNMND